MDWSIKRFASRTLEAWKKLFDDQQEARPREPAAIPVAAAPLAVARPTGGSFQGAPGRERFAHADELRSRLQGEFTAVESEQALEGAKSAANMGSNAINVVPMRETEALRTQALGSSTTRSVGGVAGVAAGLYGMAHHVRNFRVSHVPDLAIDAGNAVTGSSQSVAAVKEAKALADK